MKNDTQGSRKRPPIIVIIWSVRIFFVVMFAAAVAGIIPGIRPKTSVAEKRELTKFPAFSAGAFLDGDYTSDISLWYSDTFPLRDELISADQKLKTAYGIQTSTRMVGGNVTADEIPTLPAPGVQLPDSDTGEDSVLPTSIGAGRFISYDDVRTSSAPAGTDTQTQTQSQTQTQKAEPEPAAQPPASSGPVTAPVIEDMDEVIRNQIQAGLYVSDGAAYSIYYYDQYAADVYVYALEAAARKLAGTTNVYSILVPNSSGIMLSEEELSDLGGSDQRQAIQYYNSRLVDAIPVPIFDTLRAHNNEYLYFRTDHHWTQMGAYYAYRQFCSVKGWVPHELYQFQSRVFYPFLGTSYSAVNDEQMANNPDSVTAYIPMGTNDLTYWDVNGNEIQWHVIEDVSEWLIGSKYYTFIGGDFPLSIIENPNITDGSSCLLMKESFGNCFAPFLVDHYQTVYIVDFRYFDQNISNYAMQLGVDDLIVMNNISIITSEEVAETIAYELW